MPDRARPAADPYATLGLPPGASSAEVKRAYRRLAKEFHPDFAGEAAVPRFLAIQAAYDQLITGRPVVRGASAAAASTPSAATAANEPWRADPARARAARERARAGRSGGGRAAGSASSSEPRSRSGPRPAAGASGAPNPSTASGTSGSGPGAGAGRAPGGRGSRRSTRKATLGSTSYDEARDRDPNDAAWSGASWYGPSSGEYWIINPREYADPRKHGPEYQRRARQQAADAAAGIDAEPDEIAEREATPQTSTHTGTGAATDATWSMSGATGRAGEPPREQTTAAPPVDRTVRPRRWAPAGGSNAEAGRDPRGWAPPEARKASAPRPRLPTAPRELVGTAADDPIRRLAIALVAWPPIGLAAAFAVGEVTGCNGYSAECTGTEPLLPWLTQAAILGLLLLLPPIARLLAGGAIGVIVALVPITMFLLVVGASGAPQAGFALAFLLAVAWVVGVGWAAIVMGRRRSREGTS